MGYAILIVDDDGIQRTLMAQYLGLAGFEVREASDGAQALVAVETQPPDLVLLDLQMPEIDGFEVLRRLRAAPETRDVPVLLVSSIARDHVKVRGLELGADDYLVKPCAQAELLARVRAGLRRAARYRKLEHALAGEVEAVGLDTLLHTLQIGGRTARIRFTDVAAELVVGQGVLHACQFLRFTGVEALQRLFLVARGRFNVVFDTASPAPTERSLAAVHVLIDALVAVDEVRRALDGDLASNPVVDLSRDGSDAGELEVMRSSLPMSVMELIVAADGDIRANAQRVASAVRDGALRVVT